MDTRKVQITGGASYMITLPKEWIKSLNIKKNDSLGLVIQPDKTLTITPYTTTEHTPKTKKIDADTITNPTYLFRYLIGSYIAGYNSIEIKSQKKLTPPIKNAIRTFTRTAIGQEIVEETENRILIKDLLNPKEMPVENTLKRFYLIVKGMHEDAINALGNDKQLSEDVIKQENETNRLHWLMARHLNLIMSDTTLAIAMNTTTWTANSYYRVSMNLEHIGDHAVIIAKNIVEIEEKKIDAKTLTDIKNASKLAITILNESMESLFKKDINTAQKNMDLMEKLQTQCQQIHTRLQQQKNPTTVQLSYITTSIERTGEFSKNISEQMIDYLV